MFNQSKSIMLSIFLMVFVTMSYSVFQSIDFGNRQTFTELLTSDDYGLNLFYQFERLNYFTVATEEGVFTEIYINEQAHTNLVGDPKLPMSRRFIAVPLGAEVLTRVVNYQVTDYQLVEYGIEHPIIPAQHPVPKCPDSDPIPFEYNAQSYERATYTGQPLVRAEELGIMRGIRLYVIELYPVDYNPQVGSLRIYNDIEVEVTFIGGDYIATEDLRQRTYSPYFEFLYEEQILNYTPVADRQNLTRYPVKYIIISHQMFSDALVPFIDWKIMKGFETIIGYIGSPEVGSTTTSIKNYIEGIWNAATPEDPAPSFVLFVGDTAQVPPFSGQTGSHPTDLNYVRLEGADFLPEMFYGRFSANNLNELQPQIDKTLVYEKLDIPDTSYLGEAVLIAGADSYWATSHGNGHINYATTHYFNASNGISPYTYLYPASTNSSQAIINNVSNGVGYANYTAHGSTTSWSSPSFTITNVYNLQNENKYPFVVGNCCITNKFDVYECFGEAWLRAPNKGAIGYIGGNDNTYWNEDFWWGVGYVASIPSSGNALPYESTGPGMFDRLFHTHGETFINWYTTGGAMIYAGNLAVEQSNSTLKNYYWEIYSLMGDPSLTPYMRVPLENTANYPQQIFLGVSQIQISAQPYSYIGLTMDGQIYGAGLIGENGVVNLPITPFTTPGTATLVITLQNHEPIITEIQVIPNEGPYVVLNDYEIDVVGSNSSIPEYGDTVRIHISLENVGVEQATNVSAQLSTTDPYVTIVDGYEFVGNIAPEAFQIIMNAFQLTIADNIPNQHQVFLILNLTDNSGETWTSNLSFHVNAPSLTISYPEVNDPTPGGNNNGVLDPGETATLQFPVINAGNSTSPETVVRFTSGSQYLSLVSDEFVSIGAIGVGITEYVNFTVTADSSLPIGSSISIGMNIFSGSYIVQETMVLPVGLLVEDFVDFNSYPWTFSGNANWIIDSSQSYSGNTSARSGVITHNQSSSMSVTMDTPSAGEISFYLRVSSEANYDFLRFFINNQQQGEWSGNVNWQQVSFPVQAGNNTFRWTYIKDYSVSSGSDCAWVDYIIFPASGTATSGPIFATYPQTIDFGEVGIGASETKHLIISNFGNELLTGTISTYEGFTIDNLVLRSNLDNSDISTLYLDTVKLSDKSNKMTRSNLRSDKVRTDYNYSVPTESYLTLSLIFSPEEVSDYSGQVTLTSNDPNNNLTYININASGAIILFPPINLAAEISGNTVYLTWNSIINPGQRMDTRNSIIELYGFNVYRDNMQINDVLITETAYTDNVPGLGSYEFYVTAVYDEGESEPSETILVQITSAEEDLVIPYTTKLRQNYPNPFNPETTIEFAIDKRQIVKIEIYNIAGQLVKTLINEELEPGNHKIVWQGTGQYNRQLPSGIYLYRMTTQQYNATRKMIILK